MSASGCFYLTSHEISKDMDVFLYVLAICLALFGIVGSIVPGIAGPPFGFLGILAMMFTSMRPVSITLFIVTLVLCVLITILDYVFPVWGTKKFGGTKAGTRGSTIGLVVGLLVTILFPVGFIAVLIGPFLGAYIGEINNDVPQDKALRSAFGSFIGFLAGTLVKVVYSVAVLVIVIRMIVF